MNWEHLVNNIKFNKTHITLIIICLITTVSFSQFKSPPQFLDKTNNNSSYNALYRFINHLDDSIIYNKDIRPCCAGLGVFTFQVTENGAVDIVNFTGDLPLIIVKQIKNNILKTSDMWSPQFENEKPSESLPFVFIYYVNVDLLKGGCKNAPQFSKNESAIGWELEKTFNTKKNQDIIITNNAYVLPVGSLTIMR